MVATERAPVSDALSHPAIMASASAGLPVWPALILGVAWYLYRRMYVETLAIMAAFILIGVVLIAEGRDYVATAWWLTLLPGLVVAAVVLSTNRLSDAIGQGGRS